MPASVGAYLAVTGTALLAAEALAGAVMVGRWRRRVHALGAFRPDEFELIRDALAAFRASSGERSTLARPHRRAWRWYRHPLVHAYRESRRRRRSR